MAYNVESLIHILEKEQYHLTLCCKTQIESLLKQLRDLVQKIPPTFTQGTQHLDRRIRDAAHKLEDVVESHIIDQVHSHTDGERSCELDLKSLMEEFKSIREEMSYMPMDDPPLSKERNRERWWESMKSWISQLRVREKKEMSNMPMVEGDRLRLMQVLIIAWWDMMKRWISQLLVREPPDAEETNSNPCKTVVGIDEDMDQLLDRLKNSEPKELQIIPIVGMGGIGKTTLARKLYTHPSIASSNQFDARAWIIISQQFDARHALLSLLDCFGMLTDKMHQEKEEKLHLIVYQTLLGRRYLIVVDDVWDTGPWDRLRALFPKDERRGSRIILTTRHWKVAKYVHTGHYEHKMRLLNEHSSWSLLVENCFGQDPCPLELVETGKRIAANCGGLPLAIIVMAGHLCKSKKTLEVWDSVERDYKSASTKIYRQPLEILSKSYNHLPYHLKPCFLYIAAFHEFNEIRASKVIKLWIAEGIIKPADDKPLEEVAHVYLDDLIGRSLLSVCQVDPKGKVRTFKIHHLLRELCERKALEEKFLWLRDSDDLELLEGEGIMRRVCVHPLYQAEKFHLSRVRSYLCFSHATELNTDLCSSLRLLRVLDIFQLEFVQFPSEIEKLINLRYLGLTCHSRLPSSILRFLNLQTLIVQFLSLFKEVSLPPNFWKLTQAQLRHIKFKGACIRYLPQNDQNVDQTNLETLSTVQASGISELLQRSPKLKKLGIYYDTPIISDINLACLESLEKLKCSSVWPSNDKFLSFLKLPNSLKKLTLSYCIIPSKFIAMVGSLCHLEQLRLQQSDFLCEEDELAASESYEEDETAASESCEEDELTVSESGRREEKWEPAEEGFPKLVSLVMENLNLVHWVVYDNRSFPVLQRLEIHGCLHMKEISLEIGATPTLELIKVDKVSTSLLDSVREMQKEQQDFGNDSLKFDLPQETES